MGIDDHLLRDEKILASAKAPNATLYATNKRIISYERGLVKEKVDSLYYSKITSVSLISKSYFWLVILGIIALVIGVLIGGGLGGLLILLGIIGAIIGVLYKPSWYQLKVAGLSDEDLALWRTVSAKEDAKTFARFVEDQIGVREVPLTITPPVVIPVTPPERELKPAPVTAARIYCHQCGAENSADATYCHKCGQKLKAS